jgi:hypothetical protein
MHLTGWRVQLSLVEIYNALIPINTKSKRKGLQTVYQAV